MTVVRIKPTPGTQIAEDKDAAQGVRLEMIMPALEIGESIELDFGGVELATQSYVHALISAPIMHFGRDVLDRISFRNCNAELRQLILTVVEYTLMALEAANGESSPAGSGSR